MSKPLVIVESPAKARTLSRLLGDEYRIEASVGHVRDLPERASEVPAAIKGKAWGKLAVDVEHGFRPYYVVTADKKKRIADLRAAVADADEVLLATDPDREGESISWHLAEVLKPEVPVRRIEFHEVTEEAVRRAIGQPRDINLRLVDAQESRRIVDRLYGYLVSPVLWKKVQSGLSAGRVQSVAVRLVVEREEERSAFRAGAYWDLEARLRAGSGLFSARLDRVGDDRVANGRDFDATSGQPRDRVGVRLLGEAEARGLAMTLSAGLPWRVTAVDARPATQRPSPPFTTSTLQQEANRKLGFSADRTMRAAQTLFGEGIISYHRTDSTTLSQRALDEVADAIRELYGTSFYSGPRQYRTRVKNAQEAHEAIRPTGFGRTPDRLAQRFGADERRLYELIWKRAVASQMTDARLRRTTLEITADGPDGPCVFIASGRAIEFAGFLRAYVEGSDDPAAELGDSETLLPALSVGELVTADGDLALESLEPVGHETQPPARYTDASLVKRLEDDGIGRPSTYASIIDTIEKRGYVWRQGKALVPTFTAYAVTRLLVEHFGPLVELGFTGAIEERLDEIAKGERDRTAFLDGFYTGDPGRSWPGLKPLLDEATEIDYPVVSLGREPGTDRTVVVRTGKFGPYVQIGEGGDGGTASIPDDLPPADLTLEAAIALVEARTKGPRSLGTDPASGLEVYLMSGRYGPYVQLGPTSQETGPKPRRSSLTKQDDPATITLERALQLLSLPRVVGIDPDSGEPVEANFGRFGPYVRRGGEYRSLTNDAEVFSTSLEAALELLARPKPPSGKSSKVVLREIGRQDANGASIQLLQGRYGPYVTDGTTNASLPRDMAPDAVTVEIAADLLKAREGAPKRRGRTARSGRPRRARSSAPKRARGTSDASGT